MTNYYFIGTFIPKLQIGILPEISIESYSRLLKENLNSSDFKTFLQLKLFFDIENIHLFLNNNKINCFGNFNEITLEEALLNEDSLPTYIYDYMHQYESQEERLKNFSKIYSAFFNEPKTGFLKELFKQERSIHLVLVALRAKKMNRSIFHELQFEDSEDDLVATIIAQKDAPNFEPPLEFSEIKTIYEKNYEKPFELHQALVSYRFQKIEEMVGLQVFTLDRLLAYYYQLILAHQWALLDKEKGLQMINTIVKDFHE